MEPEPDPFTNIKKVDDGFLLTDENIIALANYIQELQFKNQQLEAENSRLQNQVDALDKALQEERAIVDKLLAEKDTLIAEKDNVIKAKDSQIELLKLQVSDWKFLYENSKPSFVDKAQITLGGAGVATIIILLAQMLLGN